MLNKLTAYPGGQAQKDALVAAMHAHIEADTMIRDYGYWAGGKGCAVGCALKSLDVDGIHCAEHARYESLIGVPEQIAHLQDAIFEGLPDGEAQTFAADLLDAIPVGADLAPAYHKFMAWMLDDPSEGVIRFANDAGKIAITAVSDLHRKSAEGLSVAKSAWSAAESAAGSAAGSAAWSAAWSAAGSAAESAAWSAAGSAAWSAAWSAAGSAAESAAWSAAGSAAWSAAGSAAESAAGSAAGSAAESDAWSAAESAAGSAAYQSFAKRLIAEIKAA